MKHTIEVVSFRKMSNGHVRYYLRCCGMSDTDHSHEVAAAVAGDPAKLQQSFAALYPVIAKQHEDMINAPAIAISLKPHEEKTGDS